MKTVTIFDTDVGALIEGDPVTYPEGFDPETGTAKLWTSMFPNQPGSDQDESREATIYADTLSYLTVAGDFAAGRYTAQFRVTVGDAVVVNTEIFRLVVDASV
jgi:hypothetical protein